VVKKEIPYPKDLHLQSDLKLLLMGKDMKIGSKYSFPFLDPTTMSTSSMNIEVEGEEELEISGQKMWAYKVRMSFMGMDSYAWMTTDGQTLKELAPLGFTSVKETEKEALTEHWENSDSIDIISSTAIKPEGTMPDPAGLKMLKINISGIEARTLALSSERQEFDGFFLTMRRENLEAISSYQVPCQKKEMLLQMAPTPFVQSDNDKIAGKAREIIGAEKDALKASRLLYDWVYKNIKKKFTISLPSALEVLKVGEGDCNEHTVLYAALARSVGIPTRMAIGVVSVNGGFYYHAWPEVYVGQWLSIDPTLGQFPSDVSHIRIIEGDIDKWIELFKVVGKIRIKIRGYE
jgi:hypothetical protein